jgi:hypothetical protein
MLLNPVYSTVTIKAISLFDLERVSFIFGQIFVAMVVYNLHAFFQAVIFIAFCLLGYWLNVGALYDRYGLTSDNELLVLAYLGFAIAAVTEVFRIRGRVFWLPSWIFFVLIILALSTGLPGYYPFANVIVIALLCLGLLRVLDAQFRNDFDNASVALKSIKRGVASPEYKKDFWKKTGEGYVHPSKLFLLGYPVFSTVFGNSVRQRDFIDHYLRMIAIMRDEVTDTKQLAELRSFEYFLEAPKRNQRYKHPSDGLANIAAIIKQHKKMYR